MDVLETKFVDILKDLKENCCASSVKAEFAAEGTSFEEITFLKEISIRAGLDLTLKIGGCEAVKDLCCAKEIEVNRVVAPMIESEYALKKFVNSVNAVFSKDELNKIKLFINIETITAFKNIDKIINSDFFENLSGVVFGRSDMINSMELSPNDFMSDKFLAVANDISLKIKNTGKELIIGGGISSDSLPFFEKIPYFSKIETRKIIFNTNNAQNNRKFSEGIMKALEFEILWLKSKENFGGIVTDADKARINLLKKRYKSVELSEVNE